MSLVGISTQQAKGKTEFQDRQITSLFNDFDVIYRVTR